MLAALPTDKLIALRRRCPDVFWLKLCQTLSSASNNESLQQVLARLPATTNAEIYAELKALLGTPAAGEDWAGMGAALELAGRTIKHIDDETHSELIWTGPAPSPGLRRLDQALYDLIFHAERRILLVTFAAAHVSRLNAALYKALEQGVKLRLILEFRESSGGQLSFDALHAFNDQVRAQAEIYYWPLELRDCNPGGRPGKLHAKCAVVDSQSFVSSANLTDDAFIRNMELGTLSKNRITAENLWSHFDGLIQQGTLRKAGG
jgi:cardiolipin synthase